jgi:hypothetical protein
MVTSTHKSDGSKCDCPKALKLLLVSRTIYQQIGVSNNRLILPPRIPRYSQPMPFCPALRYQRTRVCRREIQMYRQICMDMADLASRELGCLRYAIAFEDLLAQEECCVPSFEE